MPQRRVPSETKKLRGTFRKDRSSADEPADPVSLPECPDWLDDEGRSEWERLAPLLVARRTVTDASRGLLATLCQAWSVFVHASRKFNEMRDEGDVSAQDVRRWSAAMTEASGTYMRAAAEFGIGPASRTKVVALPEQKGDDGKAKFFRVG